MTSSNASDRDAASLRILGSFFLVLGVLVLIGTFWTLDNARAMVVNLGSGLVLGGVGGLMIMASARRSKPHGESENTPS